MTIDERRRLEMFERLIEVLGSDVAETLLAHLPPPGERVATASQLDARIDGLEARLDARIDGLDSRIDGLASSVDERFVGLRAEMHHLFEVHEARLAARWRRDLLLLATPQFLVLLGIVVSLNL